MLKTKLKTFSVGILINIAFVIPAHASDELVDKIVNVISSKTSMIQAIKVNKNGNLVANRIDIYGAEGQLGGSDKGKKLIWSISAPSLPVTEMNCVDDSIDLCDQGYNERYHGACYKPCLLYGPEIISWDKTADKLYLSVKTTSIGNGGGPVFTFVADLKQKKVRYLGTVIGPFSAELSPSGAYILLFGLHVTTVMNTVTGDLSELDGDDGKAHTLSHLNWISETQLKYHDSIRSSKMDSAYDEALKRSMIS